MRILMLLFLGLIEVKCQVIATTNGISGEKCGTHRCRDRPMGSSCVGDVCMCQCPFTVGIGMFQCAYKDDVICSLYSDPMLQDFAGFHVHLPVSQKFVMARVTTQPCRHGPARTILSDGRCDVTVLAWGGYLRGKSFVKGVEVRYNVTQDNSGPPWFRNFRLYGQALAGTYTFTIDGNDEANPDLPGTTYGNPTPLMLGKVGGTQFEVDELNNMVSVSGVCGVRVSIRPADRARTQELVSGVSVSVNSKCAPQYPFSAGSVCASPSDETGQFETLAETLTNQTGSHVTPRVAAMFFILKNKVAQIFPGAPPSLQLLTSLQCEDKAMVLAVSRCLFIQDVPKLVKCLTPIVDQGNQVTGLFGACLNSVCTRSVLACDSVKATLEDSRCLRFLPSFTGTILEFDCLHLANGVRGQG